MRAAASCGTGSRWRGLIGLIIIFGAGIFANYIAPYTFDGIDLNNILAAPTTAGHHFFGTDEIGRDYFSRVIYGIRTSEEVGVLVASSRRSSGSSSERSPATTAAGSTTS